MSEEKNVEFTDEDKWDALDTLHDIRFELGIIAAVMLGAVVVGIIAFVSYLHLLR